MGVMEEISNIFDTNITSHAFRECFFSLILVTLGIASLIIVRTFSNPEDFREDNNRFDIDSVAQTVVDYQRRVQATMSNVQDKVNEYTDHIPDDVKESMGASQRELEENAKSIYERAIGKAVKTVFLDDPNIIIKQSVDGGLGENNDSQTMYQGMIDGAVNTLNIISPSVSDPVRNVQKRFSECSTSSLLATRAHYPVEQENLPALDFSQDTACSQGVDQASKSLNFVMDNISPSASSNSPHRSMQDETAGKSPFNQIEDVVTVGILRATGKSSKDSKKKGGNKNEGM